MRATDTKQILPGICVWQNCDSSVKGDLFSSALFSVSGLYLVDPILLIELELIGPSKTTSIAGIVVLDLDH